jgi:glutaredoxin
MWATNTALFVPLIDQDDSGEHRTMLQPCSCQSGADSELKLDNGKTIRVQRLSETFFQFQAMGMPTNAMVGDMLAERVRPIGPLAEPERPLYKAALLREYARFLQGTQDGVPVVQVQQGGDSRPPEDATQGPPAVEIFSKPTCPYTRGLRRKLEHDRVKYVEYDVQSDPAMLQLMLKLNGGRRNVPTVRQGDQVTVGFHGM